MYLYYTKRKKKPKKHSLSVKGGIFFFYEGKMKNVLKTNPHMLRHDMLWNDVWWLNDILWNLARFFCKNQHFSQIIMRCNCQVRQAKCVIRENENCGYVSHILFAWKSFHLSARKVEHYKYCKTEFLTSFRKIFYPLYFHLIRGFSLCRNWVCHIKYDPVMNELLDKLAQRWSTYFSELLNLIWIPIQVA